MLVEKKIDVTKSPTDEQIEMLRTAEERPITYDEDSPALTEEQLKQFKKVSEERRMERRKQTVTLRLSPQALAKARSLGKGYTSILSRMLEEDLNDNERIRSCL